MTHEHHIYIALGSNVGDKFLHLQHGIDAIFKRIGTIEKISPVYETPAWGFDGDSFYNCVILIRSANNAENVLRKLLDIETKQGRVRNTEQGYQSRSLDLDILFYGEDEISSETLKVPHPQLAKRRFVLQPLSDIAPDLKTPNGGHTIAELLEQCEDDSVIQKLPRWLKNPKDSYNLSKYNYISIEGNIGAGKTTLATKIATDFNAKLILERFADNPFLPKFYDAPSRYAFPLEMSFLADRYQQTQDDLNQLDLFKDFVVADYDIYKSLVFAKITLQEEEFRLYRRLFDLMYKESKKPDLYVFLFQSTERLLTNIKNRKRDYEQTITPEYLDAIQKGYIDHIKAQGTNNVKVIDISEMDFVESREDYLTILEEIITK